MTILNQNTRHNTFDLLKGLAVIFMIQVHIVELFASQSFFSSKAGTLLLFLGGPPCAPVFLFVFGYFIASSRKNALQLFKRGFILLFTALILNIALNLNLIQSVLRGIMEVPLMPYVFGVDILVNAGFSLFVLALLKQYAERQPVVVAFLIILTAFAGKYMPVNYPQEGLLAYPASVLYGASWWSYFPLFPWLAYSLTGFFAKQISEQVNLNWFSSVKVKAAALFLFLVFILFTRKFGVYVASHLEMYYHHGLVFYFWTLAFMIFYMYATYSLQHVAGNTLILKYLRWLGKNVTAVYIVQWIIIGNIATAIYQSIDAPLILVFSFVAITALSSGLVYVYAKWRVHGEVH